MAQTAPPSVRQWKEYTIVIAMGTLSVLKRIEILLQDALNVLRVIMAQTAPPSVTQKRECTTVTMTEILSVLKTLEILLLDVLNV